MAVTGRQISSLRRFCDSCSSRSCDPLVSPQPVATSGIKAGAPSLPIPLTRLLSLSLCARQGSYQGPGISQASSMAATVPYSQPAGSNSSAMGNAQGPAYNMPPSGTIGSLLS